MMNVGVDVKYLEHQTFVAVLAWFSLVDVCSWLIRSWDGSQWCGISTKTEDEMMGPPELFKLSSVLIVQLRSLRVQWNDQIPLFAEEMLKTCPILGLVITTAGFSRTWGNVKEWWEGFELQHRQNLRLDGKMSLCSKTEPPSSGSGFPPSSTSTKAQVWVSHAPSPSLLRWSHLAMVVVLH